jgi:5-deoxy-5-amino-3-dehydroquinate synthase
MIDAAIGGKTGVNLPEGKNLVGAFWQPAAVLCDLDALATLPERECRSGLGEMAKYHFLTGDDLLALPMEERVAACVAIKATVVSGDEREAPAGTGATGRAVLNYGHTLAHALETVGGYELLHGEAVRWGSCSRSSWRRSSPDRPGPRRRPPAPSTGLASCQPGSDPDQLVALMARDKKAIDGLTFVLDGPRGVEVVAGVPRAPVVAALARMGA